MSDHEAKRSKRPAVVLPPRPRTPTPDAPALPRTSTPTTSVPRTVTPRSAPRPAMGTARLSSNAPILAVGKWLAARGLVAPLGAAWSIEVALGIATGTAAYCFGDPIGTRFHLRLRADEWGYSFCHAGRVSTIRVIDVPQVQSSDDHHLLAATPPLAAIEGLIRQLEARYEICFQRRHAAVRTTIPGAEAVVLRWVAAI